MATYDITKIALPSGDIANLKDANATKTEASTTNGNIKIDNVETPVYRNYGNNTVLTTDKTPFLTRQTLNPTGFSGYVREKLIGASYAWNQLVQNGNFADSSGWTASNSTFTVSGNVATVARVSTSGASYIKRTVSKIAGHKYFFSITAKHNSSYLHNISIVWYKSGSTGNLLTVLPSTALSSSYQTFQGIIAAESDDADGDIIIYNVSNDTDSNNIKEFYISDLTLDFGSNMADSLYNLANNGGITLMRNAGFPIDKYTAYGNYLVSSKTSGKKIVGKNLFNIADVIQNANMSVSGNTISKIETAYNFDIYSGNTGRTQASAKKLYLLKGTYVISFTASVSTSMFIDMIDDSTLTPTGEIAFSGTSGGTFTVPRNGYVCVKIAINSAVTISNLQIEYGTSATTYEPYSSYVVDLGNDELRGLFKLVNNEIVADGDVKESNGKITRNYDIRSYQSGDENDSTVITDMTNTIYPLTTSTTEQSTPFADPMSLVGATTEEYIDDRTIPCPVGAERQYMGQSEDIIPIPSAPQSDGVWVQKCYVSGGKAQYVWELEE